MLDLILAIVAIAAVIWGVVQIAEGALVIGIVLVVVGLVIAAMYFGGRRRL